ncbi:hypothetical protein [Piscirickettsia salmonis]|uniref:hypothetical protein n=1 Tax=Piscirickettsia salmonis TaxID=1238 RepID=UPI0007C93E7F|nr:hypothetical protein A0O36_02610 [Piscirickettsiaceae bacterium NZ-RLO1]
MPKPIPLIETNMLAFLKSKGIEGKELEFIEEASEDLNSYLILSITKSDSFYISVLAQELNDGIDADNRAKVEVVTEDSQKATLIIPQTIFNRLNRFFELSMGPRQTQQSGLFEQRNDDRAGSGGSDAAVSYDDNLEADC